MTDTAQGLPVERRADTAAANGDFTGIVTRLDTPTRESGWDPYEVWRTRVKAPAKTARARRDRARDLKR
jgi:hypothetical protein